MKIEQHHYAAFEQLSDVHWPCGIAHNWIPMKMTFEREDLRRMVRQITPRAARNWLRNPRASLRWLRHQARWRWTGAVRLDLGEGVQLSCHPESARTFSCFLHNPDARQEWATFRATAQPGMRFWDLGAHYGFFSLAALQLGGEQAQVLAIEPSATAFHLLTLNLALTGAGDRGLARQLAVGPENGHIAMLSAGINGEHYLVKAMPGRPDAHEVPQSNLPGLYAITGWTPTHIKIDIESYEYELLAAPDNLAALKNWRPILFLELHCQWLRERQRDPKSVLAHLAANGYHIPDWPQTEALLQGDVVRLCLRPGIQ